MSESANIFFYILIFLSKGVWHFLDMSALVYIICLRGNIPAKWSEDKKALYSAIVPYHIISKDISTHAT